MMRFRTTSVATAIVMCLSGVIPAQAFQMPTVQQPDDNRLPTVQVRDEFQRLGRDRNGNIVDMPRYIPRHGRNVSPRDRWDGPRVRDNGPRYGWYNGHRGYSDRRPGYRYHNGYWFPMAAFAAGAIIGGAMQQSQPSYGNSHTSWCANRWRSYRAYDNTYQPYNGPRAQCVSPYGR